MRVEVRHLDSINNLVGELVVIRNSMEQNQTRLRQFLDGLLGRVQQLGELGQRMRDQYDRSLLEAALFSSRSSAATVGFGRNGEESPRGRVGHSIGQEFDKLEMDQFTAFHTLAQEIIELIVRVRESSSDIEFAVDEAEQIARQFRQVTTQLQEGLNRARMVPFSQIADRLPRAVRDLSIKTGKQASLVVEGRDTLIDKAILEELSDPMTHLVNNALVHGIEPPEERRRLGKPPEGKITVKAFYQGNQTIIVVADDGAGIPVEKIKAKAQRLGLLSEQATEEEVFNVLFHPGFSVREASEVDDLAGRGVGLDVVRRNITDLRGSIQVDSVRGKGTTFTIRLPLTLSISKAMVCVSDKALIAFPLDGVEEMLDVPVDEVQPDEQGRPSIPWRDQRLPFQPLSNLLSYSRSHSRSRSEVYSIAQEEGILPIVVLQSAGQYVALQVDSFVEEQEIVIKQLRGPVPKPPGISGATVLGNGRVLPIADVLELVDMAQGRRRDLSRLWAERRAAEPRAEETHQTTVLIVDDSIAVRELLSMSFQKVGYRVEQARDGQDAWEKLRGGLRCDLIFCDIEMPRMDGLELLSRIRADSNLRHIPVAMLTSRGAERHRQTARELGATAYFTKPYLEEELFSAAARMLQGEQLLAPNPTS
jgi:chemosensory pili system protein ChpA (sensor histidine kinase/response regulator)